MIFRVRHTTHFTYEKPAYESHNEARMTPRPSPGQRCLETQIEVSPPAAILEFRDAFGNTAHAISVHEPHDELTIVAECVVERSEPRALKALRVPFSEFLADDDARSRDRVEFLNPTRHVPFSDRLRRFFWSMRPAANERVDEFVNRVGRLVRDQFEYEPGATHVHSSVDDILAAGGGVCQDFAHLMIGVLRLAGIPTRYVSGYLAPETGTEIVEERESHAWVEVLLPGAGWVGFDPTHRGRTTNRHVRIAVGRDYADATPLRGVYRSSGGTRRMGIDVSVEVLRTDDEEAASGSGQSQQ
jgi:transglutaminase-like putative cysteine protease